MPSDRNFKWKTKNIMLTAQYANDILGTAGADTGSGGGGPIVAVQAGAGVLSIVQMGAADDEVHFFLPIPYDMNVDSKVLGRVWFCHSSTDADAPVWTIKTKFHAKAVTLVDFDTSDDSSVSLDAHTCSTTAESLEVTDWADLEWDTAYVDGDVAAGIILICDDLGSASANEIELIGLELKYTVDKMDDRRRTTEIEVQEQPTR